MKILILLVFSLMMAMAADPAFTLVVNTDNPGTSLANQFMLPLASGTTYDFTVDWGDGSSESITTATSPKHTYPVNGIYTVRITERTAGGFSRIFFNNQGDRQKLLQIANWGAVTWSSLERAFFGCTNLVITATDEATAKTSAVTNFSVAWSDCPSLTTFPKLDTSAGTNFYYTWSNCTGLTDFPLLNTGNATNFHYTWYNCRNLTSFPLLDTAKVTNFTNTWWGCSRLTSFPPLNTASGIIFQGTWISCRGLTSFPPLNTANGTDFSTAWYGCTGLTSFPLLDTSKGTTFNAAWVSCLKLTSFPELDVSLGTDFSNAWNTCTSLTSFPQLNTAAGTNFSGAWRSCTHLTSFPLLDTAAGTDFSSAWSGCSSLTSFPLLNTSAGTNFSNAWFQCGGLTEFPALDVSQGTDFSAAWFNCSGLTSFPQLNTGAGTNFKETWAECRGLTTFPLLDTRHGTDFSYAWYNCINLTEFPQLDTAAGTTFKAAWYSCGNLTTFPLLNTAAGTDFSYTWNACTALTVFPPLDLGNLLDGTWCLNAVTLTTDSYSDLLQRLATQNTHTGVVFSGGNSRYNPGAAATARNSTLIANRGWTISDGGELPPPVITSAASVNVPRGTIFTYQIVVSNQPTSLAVTGLPAYLTFDSATGVITGTVPMTIGTTTVTIAASNVAGTGTLELAINITPPPPVITSIATVSAPQYSAFTYQITATENPTSFGAKDLPAGLILNTATGAITGTAPATMGEITFTILAINTGGSGSQTVTLTVTAGVYGGGDGGGGGSSCGLGGGFAGVLTAWVLGLHGLRLRRREPIRRTTSDI